MRLQLIVFCFIELWGLSVCAQTDVKIHPAQVGLFGVGTGYILTSNPSGSGGQWSTSSSVINSAVTGSIGNIMSYAAGGWTANTFLNVSGSDLRVGSTAASHIRFIPSTPEISLFNAGNIDARFGADALGFYTNVGLSISGPCTTTGNLIVGGSINTSLPFRAPGIISAPVSTAPASAGAGSITCWAEMTSPAFINFVENGVGYHGTVGSVAGGGIEITTGGETPGVGTRRLFVSSAGNIGIATSTPARTLHVHGGLRVTQSNGSATGLWGSDANGDFAALSLGSGFSISSGTLNAAFLPSGTNFGGDVSGTASNLQINSGAVTGFDIANNTVTSTNLSNTGVTSGTYGSSSQTPVITVGTDGRLISASSATTSNLYSADGTIPASTTRTVTLGDGAGMRIDATNWSSSPATPLILKGNASTASYRFLEAVDSDNTMRFRGLISTSLVSLSSTTRAIEINGATTVGLTCGTGQFIVDAGGYMRLNSLTSNPPSPQNGAFWHNSTEGKLKIRQTTTQTVATVENDVIGNSTATRTGNFTLAEQDFHTILDANTASFTVTLDGTMREGIIYTFECRRNGTNTISFDAASGFVLAFPGLSSFPDDGVVACGGAGTGRQAPHLTYMSRRNGANITIF